MPRELPNATSQWGAAMGRRDTISEPDFPVKMHLRHMPFVDSCYDQGGAYWGMGDPIFHAWGEMFMRAKDRFHARLMVRKEFPNARFYR